VRKERNEKADGGVAIFVNNKVKHLLKDSLYDGDGKIEVCTVELYTDQDKMLIVSC
jgi:hypothetical protein